MPPELYVAQANRIAELEIKLAQFEQGEDAGESEWTTLRNKLNLVKTERDRYREALEKIALSAKGFETWRPQVEYLEVIAKEALKW